MPPLSENIGRVLGGARSLVEITPDDEEDLEVVPRSLLVTADGDVTVIAVDDVSAVSLGTHAAGTVLPVRVRRVTEATTATVVGLL